jgi:hypothetical protein
MSGGGREQRLVRAIAIGPQPAIAFRNGIIELIITLR